MHKQTIEEAESVRHESDLKHNTLSYLGMFADR